MTKFAVLSMDGRRIVGVVAAKGIFDAVRRCGEADGDYVEIGADGFIVHVVPDDFECADGTDQKAVDEVERWPICGYVRSLRVDEGQ